MIMNQGEIDTIKDSEGKHLPSRQKKIYERVMENGYVSIEHLSQHFAVTPQTIRRDINKLCSEKLLRRYHGGAGLLSSVENFAYAARQSLCSEEKVRVAKLVAAHIPNNASLFIDIGTSTEEVARQLMNKKRLRIITNNINVAMILSKNPGFEILIAGGMVRNRDLGVTGQATVDFIKQFKVDYGILSVAAIDPDGTLIDFDYQEVRVCRAFIENSRQVFLVADHTKFERNAMVRIGEIGDIDAVFTDMEPPAQFKEVLAATDTALYIAAP